MSDLGRATMMLLDWPERKADGKAVTTTVNQSIWKAAAQAAVEELPVETAAFLELLPEGATDTKNKNWRRDYISIVEAFVRLQATATPATVVRMCQAGLDCATSAFVVRSNATTMSISEALESISHDEEPLTTITYIGTQSPPPTTKFQLASPHGTDSQPVWVTGDDAVAQLEAWTAYGCMEPSACAHAATVCRSDHVARDFEVAQKIFVLLGVTSEMGPALHLLKIPGAHVLGVARAGSKLNALTTWFQEHGPASTTLQVTSADLLSQTFQIARWIDQTVTAAVGVADDVDNKTIVLMPLAYMDGEANVRVTVAMDVIVTYVMSQLRQRRHPVALAYLSSPTTIYTIPPEAARDAQKRYEHPQPSSWSLLGRMVRAASLGSFLQPSNTWTQLPENDESNNNKNNSHKIPVVIYNGAYHLQGPNYILAKMMQQWRSVVAAAPQPSGAEGTTIVCAPYAPGTRTWSVLHNQEAAAAVEGMQYFTPMLTFDVQPCSSLMTAILLHQLSSSQMKKPYEQHPLELFWDGAVHGGGWRCPYQSDSIVALTYLLGKTIAKPGWCPVGALAPKPAEQATKD